MPVTNNKFQNKYRLDSQRLNNWDYGNDGYYFCEINSDSSVFGSEIFDCLKIYSENLGFPAIDKDYTPLTNIALLLKKVVDEKGIFLDEVLAVWMQSMPTSPKPLKLGS